METEGYGPVFLRGEGALCLPVQGGGLHAIARPVAECIKVIQINDLQSGFIADGRPDPASLTLKRSPLDFNRSLLAASG